MSEEEIQRVWILRKLLHDMDDIAAIEFILDKLKDTKTNDDFLTRCAASRSRTCTSKVKPPGSASLDPSARGSDGSAVVLPLEIVLQLLLGTL